MMNMRNITVSNVFGDFESGKALLEHFTAIWGGEDGFFLAWGLLMDSMDFLSQFSREEYPNVFAFADSLQNALME